MPEDNPRRSSSYFSLIIGAIVIVLLAAGGYYAWITFSEIQPETAQEPIVETSVVEDVTYASSTMKFSLKYPPGFTLQEPYAYTRVSETKPISGVKFVVPAALIQGTNLAADSGVSVEQLPRAKTCTGDIYLKANVKAVSLAAGAITFSVATSTETTGTDVFDEAVYAIPGTSPCIALRYFLHSTAAGTSTTAFNRAAVIAEFDKIRTSLVMQ